ncbi:MAG TPA: protein kinase [Polyangiales bacterium]|nr:protein kinase [Polyangiales bacterium]
MTADAQEDLPERIGQRYRVVRLLGRGGMASVYEVIDEVTGKHLAVKQLHAHRAAADGHLARLFEREFHTLTQLAHPRVVAVYDYQNQSEGACYSMELLDGGDLREQQTLPWREVCSLLVDVCSALSLLHSRRFVHRDVTPRNIRRTRDGKAKLIDFGAMVPFGTHKQVVGTPTFTAPEAATGQALDGRADLFSLGATAYYALTGRHAYPARSFATLRNSWRTQPVVPSRYVADIPPDLDQLVMALLSLSAARRPSSAAAVIERLTAIAGLSIEEQLLVQRSFLSTPSLVGRDGVLQQIRKQMIQAARGRGSKLFLTGPRGVGRSRMVDACALEAKLASATVLRADAADAEDGDWGGVRSLLEQLVVELPGEATQLIAAQAGPLAEVWPRVVELMGVGSQSASPPPNLRALVHGALLRLMDSVTRRGLLVVTADDLERVDEPTRAFITLLAQRVAGRRMVVVTAASNEAVAHGIRGLDLLRQEESTITLRPLSASETERLLVSMFGDVPNVLPVAAHLHAVSNGVPAATMQLCQHLLDRDLVGFRDGSWFLPSELDRAALPGSVADALRARIAMLDPSSRSLGQAFALSGERSLTLDQCRLMLAEADRPKILRCLDELVTADIVRASGERYAVSQPMWIPLLRSELDPALEHSLHERIAEMLTQRSDSDFKAAGHLLASGQGQKAIDLLLARLPVASRQLGDEPARLAEYIQALPSDWMHTLEAAVAEAKRLGLPRRLRLTLQLSWLQRLAITTVPRCDLARDIVDQLYADSGLRDYAELEESVPAEQLLSEALTRAQARYDATPEADRGMPPGDSIRELVRVTAHVIGMVGAANDLEFLSSMPSLEPFAPLSPAIRVLQRNVESTCHNFAGRIEQAHAGYLACLELMSDAASVGVGPSLYRYMKLAITYAVTVLETMGGRESAIQRLDALEREPLFEVNATRLRKAWALRQGDTEGADVFVRKSEMLRIRNAPSQFFEGIEGWYEALAFAEIGDVARLRATLHKLDTMAELFRAWQAAPIFARGQIQLLRGDAAGAVESFEAALAKSAAGKVSIWSANARGLLEALAEAGRVDEARERGTNMLREAAVAMLTVQRRDLHIGLASVELAGANYPAALAQLREVDAIREQWPMGAVFGGRCYELRARIAIAMGDARAFEAAAQDCDALFSQSRNPILIGRYQRLLQDAERAGVLTSKANVRARTDDDSAALATERTGQRPAQIDLSACHDLDARVRSVLSLVAERASARHIMLFLMRDGKPRLVGATEHCPAANDIDSLVSQFLNDEIEDSQTAIDPADVITSTVDNDAWTGPTGVQFVPALLSHAARRQRAVTGVLVFDFDGHDHPSDALLAGLSVAFTAANDVVPLVLEPPAAAGGQRARAKAR